MSGEERDGESAASPERRVALVIGNSAYDYTSLLRNARNDAEAVARVLGRLGFEVIAEYDLDKRKFELVIKRFTDELETADVGLVFYAGHGLQVGRKNYFVPVDAELQLEKDLDFHGVPLALVLKQLNREKKAGIVILDACRNNPLARSLAVRRGTRSVSAAPGLARMKSAEGCCIVFATGPGKEANDGESGEHSPFTAALLAEIERDDLPLSDILHAVGDKVRKATGGKQDPWIDNRLRQPFFFKRQKEQGTLDDPYAPLDALDPTTQTNEPGGLDCVVVAAELPLDISDLDRHVRLALENYESEIVDAAMVWRRARLQPAQPVSKGHTGLTPRRLQIRADQAFASVGKLRAAVRALCRADVAVFDVTRWQPGVMLLLGIRSVARRGITICSYADDYVHGDPLALPFNLQALNIAAHSANQGGKQLEPEHIIGGKILNGLHEIASQPDYLDLPTYDAVRKLGADFERFDPIPRNKRVLALCPFGGHFEQNWKVIKSELTGKLRRDRPASAAQQRAEPLDKSGAASTVRDLLVRVLDVETPRLVVQQLYELIRRVDMCVVDWTDIRPDVMFELGVRLAVNRLGAVHIGETGRLRPVPLGSDPPIQDNLTQVLHLLQRFSIIEYSRNAPKPRPFQAMVEFSDEGLRASEVPRDEEYRKKREMDFLVYETVGEALAREPGSISSPLVGELIERANLLSSDEEESTGRSSVLRQRREYSPEARSASSGVRAQTRGLALLGRTLYERRDRSQLRSFAPIPVACSPSAVALEQAAQREGRSG